MSFLVQSPQSDALVIQSNTSHGPLSLSSHMTGSMLMTHISFYLDANSIQHLFSYENKPALWRAIPAFEEL